MKATELLNIVIERAKAMPNADVEKISDNVIDEIGVDNIEGLEKFWLLLSAKTYTSYESGNRYFFGECYK